MNSRLSDHCRQIYSHATLKECIDTHGILWSTEVRRNSGGAYRFSDSVSAALCFPSGESHLADMGGGENDEMELKLENSSLSSTHARERGGEGERRKFSFDVCRMNGVWGENADVAGTECGGAPSK